MQHRVFVSSTFEELRDHRATVQDAIRPLGAIDISMEHFGAGDARPCDECIRLIEASDSFVGIYAHRYGHVPVGSKKSITEAEYDAAERAQRPRTRKAIWRTLTNGTVIETESLSSNRGLFLVHTLSPSRATGQLFDVFIYLRKHQAPTAPEVQLAEFFLGPYWGNEVFRVPNEGGLIGVSTSAYGEFLCVCRVTLRDGTQVMLDRYIDFGSSSPADMSSINHRHSGAAEIQFGTSPQDPRVTT